MSCAARHDTSNVPIRPLLDYALDFSTVEYMQLAKMVPKIQNLFLTNLTEQKFKKKQEPNRATPS